MDIPTWRRSKGPEPEAGVSGCHMHFLELHRPIESFVSYAKRMWQFLNVVEANSSFQVNSLSPQPFH